MIQLVILSYGSRWNTIHRVDQNYKEAIFHHIMILLTLSIWILLPIRVIESQFDLNNRKMP